MDGIVPLGSREYLLLLVVLALARAADFLSTWIATPTLALEANPIARRLRWKWGAIVNLVLCGVFATWPLPAIIIATTSVLVAARNFQLAWLMRSHGEENYREWFLERLEASPPGLFTFCLVAQTLLTAAVGGALIWFAHDRLVPAGVGMGIVAYAGAVAFYTVIGLWRHRRLSRNR
jgi:hypothetical protein